MLELGAGSATCGAHAGSVCRAAPAPARPRVLTMALLHLFLVIHLLMLGRTALVTDHPSFTNRLEKLFEKLESLTVAPTETLSEKIAAKLDRLNSLNPLSEETLTDEDEELLSAMQLWGVSADQLGGIARELHDVRMENDEVKSEKLVEADYSDDGWNNDDVS